MSEARYKKSLHTIGGEQGSRRKYPVHRDVVKRRYWVNEVKVVRVVRVAVVRCPGSTCAILCQTT